MSKELNQEDLTTATDEIRIRRAKKTYYFEDIINLSNVNELPNFIISSMNCLKHCNIYLSISPSRGLLSHQYKRVKENIFIITDRNSKEDIIKELKRGNILNIKDGDVYNDILKSSTFYKSLLENDENGPLKKQNVSLTPGTIMRWDNLETISFKHSIKNRGKLPFSEKKDLKINIKKPRCCHQNNSKVTTYYTQSPKNRGMLLLINNIDFRDKERKRRGAIVDQENIVKLFTQLGFDIVEEKNKTKSEMEEIVKSFATNQNLEKYDMCVTIVMSHGGKINGETVIESIDEENLSTKWIVEQFYGDNCKGMIDKPKIFIFQCCRNPINTDVQKDSHRDSHLVPRRRKIEDILICYSTIEDFSAYRDITLGSWYISDLCQVFMEHAHDTHIENLLKIVDQRLSYRVMNAELWQTSNIENIGFNKKCYLNPCCLSKVT